MPFVPTDTPDNLEPRGMFEGTGTRMFLHNMAANPDIAKRFMGSLGNEIRTYGKPGSWDWAWRKQGDANAPWTPADAHTFGGWILNHIADAVNAVGTGIAATLGAGAAAETGPGAIAAGSLAGGAASGAIEAGRQALGGMAGIPDNVDTGEIASSAVGGALAEPVGAAGGAVLRGTGKVIGKALEGAGKLVPEIAAKVADIGAMGDVTKGMGGLKAGDVLMKGAALTQGGRVPLISPEGAGGMLRGAIKFIRKIGIPEVKEADRRVLAQSASGLTVDLSRSVGTLIDRTIGNVGKTAAIRVERGSAPTLTSDITNLLERLSKETGYLGDWDKAPADTAVSVRRILQNEAFGKGAYQGAGPSKIYGRVVQDAAAKAREAIEAAMAPVDPDFSGLMKSAYDKMNLLEHFTNALKMADTGPAGRKAATQYIRGIYGDSNTAYLGALNDLEKHFSTGLRGTLVRQAVAANEAANIGSRIGNRGTGSLLPRMTSGGHIKSGAAIIGAGYFAGGPMGAIAGATLASPKLILRATAPAQAAGAALQSTADALAKVHLSGAARVLTTGAISSGTVSAMRAAIANEGGGTKQVARADGARPKRRVFIGR